MSGTLVDYARTLADRDWQAALPFIEEALEINPGDPDAANVSLMIEDARRRELIDHFVMEGRELQTAGKLQEALGKVEQGLGEHPNESRLIRLRSTLASAIENQRSETIRRFEPAASAEAPRWSAAAVGAASTPVAQAAHSPVSPPEQYAAPAQSRTDDRKSRGLLAERQDGNPPVAGIGRRLLRQRPATSGPGTRAQHPRHR